MHVYSMHSIDCVIDVDMYVYIHMYTNMQHDTTPAVHDLECHFTHCIYLLFATVTCAGQHCDAETRVDVLAASGDLQLHTEEGNIQET